MMNSSKESVKASTALASTAGSSAGNTTYRCRRSASAPRSLAAHSTRRSSVCSRALINKITNGVVKMLCPITAVRRDSDRSSTVVSSTSRLMPISSPGSMIGSVMAIRTALRKRIRARASGNAAATPTARLIAVTWSATSSEVQNASCSS